jgi:hypothetical protein
MNGPGDAILAWSQSHSTGSPEVVLEARSAAGTYVREYLTRTNGDDAGINPRVGLDRAGNAVIGWDRYICVGSQCDIDAGTAAQVRGSNGALGQLQVLSSTGYVPQVGVNAKGAAVVAWQDRDDQYSVIQASSGP